MQVSDVKVRLHTLPKEIDGIPVRGNSPYTPATLTCKVSGVNISHINALRRTAIDELEVQAYSLSELWVSDKTIIKEMIADRIAEIPILQNDDPAIYNKEFVIHEINSSKFNVMKITSDMFKEKNKNGTTPVKPPMSNNFTILEIGPCHEIQMTCKVVSKEGFEMAQHSLVSRFIFKPIDSNIDTASNYLGSREFIVELDSKGNIEPTEILKRCRQSIVKRLKDIIPLLPNLLYEERDLLIVRVPNETHTIANLWYTEIVDKEYPLDFCAYKTNYDIRNFEIQFRLKNKPANPREEVINIITDATNNIIKVFQ